MMDVDDFKLVNDTFGHLLGDEVLRWTAETIRRTIRASDIPARYGGDEFAILLPDADGEEATRTAERLIEAFAGSTFCHDGRLNVPIGVSIGVATFPADGRTAAELIAVADAGPVPDEAGPAGRGAALRLSPRRVAGCSEPRGGRRAVRDIEQYFERKYQDPCTGSTTPAALRRSGPDPHARPRT